MLADDQRYSKSFLERFQRGRSLNFKRGHSVLGALVHNYLIKLAIILATVVCLSRALKVSLFFPLSYRFKRIPFWLPPFVELLETDGWTVIPTMIVAGVWQLAENH